MRYILITNIIDHLQIPRCNAYNMEYLYIFIMTKVFSVLVFLVLSARNYVYPKALKENHLSLLPN